jgi:L-serine dehydratase
MKDVLFDGFQDWLAHCEQTGELAWVPVLRYEETQKNKTEEQIWAGVERAWAVMQDAVGTGLTRDLVSISGMINNGAKKVFLSLIHI